ncbi:unnamed protein product [Anisakis simplex]|uniref:Uncharacterized protein n=1 Tax=Anisakis simplex TaxID=6269 RepID=A0A3P6QF51_ANISI|nr:unnamed protein product [Anisakis simplex]
MKREMFSIQKALAESQNLLSELQKPVRFQSFEF